jgi:biotin carboxylase
VTPRGHAIECRINAEDPKTFAPWPGLITNYVAPGGAGVRVDGGIFSGWKVPGDYDSLLSSGCRTRRPRSPRSEGIVRGATGLRSELPRTRVLDTPRAHR